MSKSEKREYTKIAKELYYPQVMPDIIDRIMNATNENEIERIMVTARHACSH